ncbi:MAG: N-acetylmuramoyl-L-alanine amidase [Gemmatimonadetes bacterium]|nr:N-acetylmuramoyl-L-alanine amidase [Gemmatimonadota bacterium]
MATARPPRPPLVRSALLGAGIALSLSSGLHAQGPGPLQVTGVGEPVSVGAAMHRGYPAYPAWTLRALGARVDATPAGTRIFFGADTLEFMVGSPFFTAAGKPWQLVEPAYREGGVFYLPHQLFVEWLPRAYPEQIAHAPGVLRLLGGAPAAATTAAPPKPAPAGGGSGDTARRPPATPLGEPAPAPLVVIDPGHGGVDPGRIGPTGLREKDIVLQVSKRLARVLAERGYDVRMTRTTDTLIDLDDRGHMANEWRGSRPGLFLSVHANGVTDRRANGFETFFLSEARTEDERRVAEMENAAVVYEDNPRVTADDDLGFILSGLRNDFYIRASNTLAGLVQREFSDFHSGVNRGVKQAGFRVLVRAFMPAVLIELAFVSNPAEERLLGSGRFQVDAATAIADAVDRFFEEHPEWTGATH